MSRGTILGLGAVVLALAAVIFGAARWMAISRGQLVAQFAQEESQRLEQTAREVTDDFGDLHGDLKFADELLRTAESVDSISREFAALLAVVKPYRVLALYDHQEKLVLWVSDPRAKIPVRAEDFQPVMQETAARALKRPQGEIEISNSIPSDPTGWQRVVAMRTSSDNHGATIVLLFDTSSLLSRLRLAASSKAARLLVLGPRGLPTPISDATLASYFQPGATRPRSVEALMKSQSNTIRVPEADAPSFGFDRAELVVSRAAIDAGGGNSWTALLFSSTTSLRAHERDIVTRLAAAAGAIAACLIGFGAFLVVISRREAAMRERLRQSDLLAHLHEKTEKILDNIPSGVLALSKSGRITALNRVLRSRVPNSAIEGTLADAFPVADSALITRLRGLVEHARVSDRVRSVFGERLALFGDEGVYSIHAVPLEPRDPEVTCLLVIDDVTEIASLSTQLLRAEKLKTVGVLGAGIAHEMGTPLGVIRARAEYILGKLGGDHTQAQGLTTIVRQVDQLTRTIRQLLDFSRPGSASARELNVRAAADAVVELLRFETERRKLTLRVEVPADLPSISADPDQLQQALVNLVLNACDACHEGGVIRIAAAAEEQGLEIAVSDDGCGIPEGHRHQVFDPFFTTKKRGQGTGLGLTLVAQIVRNHGGAIEISSEVERGTTVLLHWPVTTRVEEQHDSAG